jgi:hypothetical protein
MKIIENKIYNKAEERKISKYYIEKRLFSISISLEF